MFQTRLKNGANDTAFCCIRQNPVRYLPSDRVRDLEPLRDCRHETSNSRQVLCRELTAVAAAGSERPETANPAGDRVDFIPKQLGGLIDISANATPSPSLFDCFGIGFSGLLGLS